MKLILENSVVCVFGHSKILDTLDRDFLLEQLKYYSVTDATPGWFIDCSRDWTQALKDGNLISLELQITIGVPQGSALRFAYIIVITVDTYADSTLVTSPIHSFEE